MTAVYSQEPISYLALGDSYTVGEQVEQAESWPYQLVSYLNSNSLHVKTPEVIAVTGWRADELQDSIATQNYKPHSFDMVSLLIGVNNQFQKKPFRTFKIDFEDLLKTAIVLSSKNEKGVFVVGIPDYSLSKFAKDKNLRRVSSRLKRYNRFIQKMSQEYNVAFYPLQNLSKSLHKNQKMLAKDGLHPSAKQYKVWVDSFKHKVADKIKNF